MESKKMKSSSSQNEIGDNNQMFHVEHQDKLPIYDLSFADMKSLFDKSFRAQQIFDWIYNKYENSFFNFDNFSKEMQNKLDENYTTKILREVKKSTSSDGSIKYLFALNDDHTIETVLLKMKDKKLDKDKNIIKSEQYTICLSSQVGCKLGCSFCLTAKGGFIRNLSAGEIVAQIVMLKKDNNIPAEKGLNVVYMGMGEPLDNLKNVVTSIDTITNSHGLSISPKRITISTSGITPKIKELGELDLKVNIAISLHATNDSLREKLIPINKSYNISSIIEEVKKFPINSRKKVMFEYLLIDGLNDGLDSAKKLVSLLHGIKAKINLIYFNPFEGTEFKRPSIEKAKQFQQYLTSKNLLCTIRDSKGLDIMAACGQLREHG